MAIRLRRALIGLATAAAVLALPAIASAAITPSLKLDQTAGTLAGSSPAVGFDAVFAPNPGTDGVKDVTFALPPGLLANANINGGACLLAATPTAACKVGTGTVTAGGIAVPVTEYLVAAPTGSGAAGGVAVVNNATQQVVTTGVVSLGATGLNVAFTNLPAALDISEMNFTLTDLRLPTSCPSPAANVTITADSQTDSTSKTATAPLNVTGCTGLSYAPTLAVSETKDAKDNGATLTFAITQAANEAASKTIGLKLPSGLGVNLSADVLCLTGSSGPGCVVGTATATSPLVPNAALANGTVTLGGSASAPTITVAFPAPFGITLVGDVSLANGTVTINNVPDVPLTSLNLNITGPNGKKAFTTSCTPSTTAGTFTSQGGVAKNVSATVTLNNCPAVSGSLSGLAAGHPKLRFKATHGKGGANIASVAVGLPGGLKFSRSAFLSHKTCVTKKGKKTCTTVTQIKGLGVSGASAKSVALKGGRLVITLKKAAGSVTVSLNGPVLTESKALQNGVKKKKVKSLTVTLNVTDSTRSTTTLPLKLAAH